MGSVASQQSFLRKRVASIDALRGFDMFWITGGEEIIRALHKMSPNATTDLLSLQFRHVEWAGFHFYDLIFPLFLFVVGLVLPFSLSRHLEAGQQRGQVYRRIFRRLVVLFVLGLVYNGLLDFNFHPLRIAGVLQRIALCYFFAALIVMNTKLRGQIAFFAGILIVYWLAMMLIPVPGAGSGVAALERAPFVLRESAPDAGVLAALQCPGQALLDHGAAAADRLGLLDLQQRGSGVPDREEQLRVLVTADRAVTPIHVRALLSWCGRDILWCPAPRACECFHELGRDSRSRAN